MSSMPREIWIPLKPPSVTRLMGRFFRGFAWVLGCMARVSEASSLGLTPSNRESAAGGDFRQSGSGAAPQGRAAGIGGEGQGLFLPEGLEIILFLGGYDADLGFQLLVILPIRFGRFPGGGGVLAEQAAGTDFLAGAGNHRRGQTEHAVQGDAVG